MNPLSEFSRRLEIVRQIARLNSGRTVFSHEENLQLIDAATVFTSAELQRMLEDTQAQVALLRPPSPSPQSRASAA